MFLKEIYNIINLDIGFHNFPIELFPGSIKITCRKIHDQNIYAEFEDKEISKA
jgi:hypothetical protein